VTRIDAVGSVDDIAARVAAAVLPE
jgi:hypothetical protein